MCGMIGMFTNRSNNQVSKIKLLRAAETIAHRGPDDKASYVSNDGRFGVGYRRLSIIDVGGGRQPLISSDGSICVTVNGEIYNHKDIRKELQLLGHRYNTDSDSEAVLHGYEQWGMDVVKKLKGMFAFSIYDSNGGPDGKGIVLLARDKLGIKPMYYSNTSDGLIYGSEIKALLNLSKGSPEPDMLAVAQYLTLSATPSPKTMFSGINKLPPGHVAIGNLDGKFEIYEYWNPLDNRVDLVGATEDEIIELILQRLTESIQKRLMADVPFGVYLSGGVDSSLNLALMSQMVSNPIDTFSVSLENDDASNENKHARSVASQFGANHNEILVTQKQFIDFLPQMAYHQDEPLADPVCVPLYYLSAFAKSKGSTVVHVGEGADELFAGYGNYALMNDFHKSLYSPFRRLPHFLKNMVSMASPLILPESRVEYINRATLNQELFWGGAVVFSESSKKRLMNQYTDQNIYSKVIQSYYKEYDSRNLDGSFLDRAIYVDLKHRLPELLLMRVDKMSMAASIEARVPFLDEQLVELANSVPSGLKYKNGITKYILRKVASKFLPDSIVYRKKNGFCGGSTNMIGPSVTMYAERVLNESKWINEIMNKNEIKKIFQIHKKAKTSKGSEIWSLLNLALWHKVWIEGESF
ncbi:MAG: asparagine synthase (glutamine-hydrolysing) [Chloroflexi bacterium]|nr:MAG: asparagine synthase (glutamine-hydrolysing) [Chloroflexota bacterium]